MICRDCRCELPERAFNHGSAGRCVNCEVARPSPGHVRCGPAPGRSLRYSATNRRIQVLVSARAWGFEFPLSHQYFWYSHHICREARVHAGSTPTFTAVSQPLPGARTNKKSRHNWRRPIVGCTCGSIL